jgi:hypothetical protein
MIDPDLQVRLLVFKAHILGGDVMNEVPTQGAALSSEVCSLARGAYTKLRTVPDSAENLRRRIFYLLVVAECTRRFNPQKYRKEAQECGQQLATTYGAIDPYPLFLRLVEVTTGVTHSAVVTDITSYPVAAVKSDVREVLDSFGNVIYAESLPALALGLGSEDLREHEGFLFKRTIAEMMSHHGLL